MVNGSTSRESVVGKWSFCGVHSLKHSRPDTRYPVPTLFREGCSHGYYFSNETGAWYTEVTEPVAEAFNLRSI